MNEITFEDYMQNSGTRGSEPLSVYKRNTTSYKKFKLKRRPDGLWQEIIEPIKPRKVICIY